MTGQEIAREIRLHILIFLAVFAGFGAFGLYMAALAGYL